MRFHPRSILLLPSLLLIGWTPSVGQSAGTADRFESEVRPLLQQYCYKCHSAEKQKGDVDLEQFQKAADLPHHAKVWQAVEEQMALGEMPPKDKPQLRDEEKEHLRGWVHGLLSDLAREHAGDPGPVVLRRLSNAEYTYTLRDLTGVDSLDPAREFPADGAAGEGFTNVGNALVMSPALLTKYLEAAKEVAAHMVLLPDGLRFSEKVSRRDWTNEYLAEIRSFYSEFTEASGATQVNLQGIVFNTNGGGRLPVEKYLTATLARRQELAQGGDHLEAVAHEYSLNARYLALLWAALQSSEPSMVLDPFRAAWKKGQPGDAHSLAENIEAWQKELWKFSSVGQIGKVGGPKSWMEPASPITERHEMRVKLTPVAGTGEVVLYLETRPAPLSPAKPNVIWERPRFVAKGRPDLLLRDVGPLMNQRKASQTRIVAATASCLEAAAAVKSGVKPADAASHCGAPPELLAGWLDVLALGDSGPLKIDPIVQKSTSVSNFEFIQGWTGKDALSILANSSDKEVRIPGRFPPHSIAVHPSPKLAVAIGWHSPITGALEVAGHVQRLHSECGVGLTWSLELRRGPHRMGLAGGVLTNAQEIQVGPIENVTVQQGDLLSIKVGPRNGSHTCGLTGIDLTLRGSDREWSLTRDLSPHILAANPHADGQGHEGVWEFYSEPADGISIGQIPAGSTLAKWQVSSDQQERSRLANELKHLLENPSTAAKDSPDEALYHNLMAVDGPLFRQAAKLAPPPEPAPEKGPPWGLAPALFGQLPEGSSPDGASLAIAAPTLLEVHVPADVVDGCEFVTACTLPQNPALPEACVQCRVLTSPPKTQEGIVADAPFITAKESPAQHRWEADFAAFREVFPAALCYTKIVPTDEVITLTQFYREDGPLYRLMLNDEQRKKIDRLWDELHFVSQDSLTMVDAFDQLWQYATQDADPKVFEPLRRPIRAQAAAFHQRLVEAEPRQLQALLDFAPQVWRRPLTDAEKTALRGLYDHLRKETLPHPDALRLTLARILTAPAFLYKMEAAGPEAEPVEVNDWELATRLSYFLSSSAPDAELRQAAAEHRLHEPTVLQAQTRRLLQSPHIRRLAVEFGCHWLHISDFDKLDEKSEKHFPTFTSVRGAMQEEPIRFFTAFFQQNCPVASLLDSDSTFLNETLAKHYGLDGIKGEEWQKVAGMKRLARGGILGFGATLAKQSGASRTSPILRGNWLCETLLGERLPRPPKGVPTLPEDEAGENLTVRAMTEKHTSDPKCAGCHRRIDPFGYALEQFDAIGRFRTTDLGGHPIDTHVKLADGTEFEGMEGLRHYLLTQRRDAFTRQFCRKLLGYALGRGIQLSDYPLLDTLQTQESITPIVEQIVTSPQFLHIRGRAAAGEDD